MEMRKLATVIVLTACITLQTGCTYTISRMAAEDSAGKEQQASDAGLSAVTEAVDEAASAVLDSGKKEYFENFPTLMTPDSFDEGFVLQENCPDTLDDGSIIWRYDGDREELVGEYVDYALGLPDSESERVFLGWYLTQGDYAATVSGFVDENAVHKYVVSVKFGEVQEAPQIYTGSDAVDSHGEEEQEQGPGAAASSAADPPAEEPREEKAKTDADPYDDKSLLHSFSDGKLMVYGGAADFTVSEGWASMNLELRFVNNTKLKITLDEPSVGSMVNINGYGFDPIFVRETIAPGSEKTLLINDFGKDLSVFGITDPAELERGVNVTLLFDIGLETEEGLKIFTVPFEGVIRDGGFWRE